MKNFLLIFLSIFISFNFCFAKVSSEAVLKNENTKVIHVNGMVCAFCSNSLKKKFKKKKEVKSVKVSLKERRVLLKYKAGKSLTDKQIKKIVKASGFKVVQGSDEQNLTIEQVK